jgi:hypothetical protein
MIPATNKLVRAGGALLKHTVKMRMAEFDVALLIEIEDRADRISSWAFDRRIRRLEQMYGPNRGSALRMTVDHNRSLDIRFGETIPPAVQRYVNAEQRARERAPQPPETE